MREDLEREAVEEESMQRFFEENYPEAIKQFKAERLTSYFIDKPDVAFPAFDALSEARIMLTANHPRAAIVFAYTSIELTIKTAFLRPIVYGLIHNDALAAFIVDLSLEKNRSVESFTKLLAGVLEEFAGIDFHAFKRDGSNDDLLKEIAKVRKARVAIVHSADANHDGLAPVAVDVASTLLNVLFPKLLQKLGLHLHDQMTICSEHHIAPLPTQAIRS